MLSFCCAQDLDIENFLHEKAIQFSQRKWCSVYLIADEDNLDNGKLIIEAYFTLSHKSIISDFGTMSGSAIQKYGGFKNAETMNFVLIGHLGKHIQAIDEESFIKSKITSKEILDLAFEIIKSASSLIPSRYALVECSNEEKVLKAYKDYNFIYFQNDGEHNQLCRAIW